MGSTGNDAGVTVNANPEGSQAGGASDDFLGTAEKNHSTWCTPSVLAGVVTVVCFKVSGNESVS